jgi:SHS2 domain-containing protein
MRYKILSHTADLRLKVFGDDYEKLFVNAALGLANILFEDYKKLIKRARGHKKITVESENTGTLVVDFLNKILSESNIEKKIFPRIKILRVSPKVVEAQLFGVLVDHFDEDVKAVSYHNAEVTEEDGKLEITLVLDI